MGKVDSLLGRVEIMARKCLKIVFRFIGQKVCEIFGGYRIKFILLRS